MEADCSRRSFQLLLSALFWLHQAPRYTLVRIWAVSILPLPLSCASNALQPSLQILQEPTSWLPPFADVDGLDPASWAYS